MRIAGIICEYNPFHLGHARHIALTRARGYDAVVCVMSGHVTQRGELAALGKWSRARAALLCGADAVFELPALFAARTADHFARGGVSLLARLGVDAISFGCETGDIGALRALAALRENESAEMRGDIARALSQGKSLARARGEAEAARGFIFSDAPNATLGVEYIRALAALGDPCGIEVIERNSAHNDTALSSARARDFAETDAARKARAEISAHNNAGCGNTAENSAQNEAPHECAADALRNKTAQEIFAANSAQNEALRECAADALRNKTEQEIFAANSAQNEALRECTADALRNKTARGIFAENSALNDAESGNTAENFGRNDAERTGFSDDFSKKDMAAGRCLSGQEPHIYAYCGDATSSSAGAIRAAVARGELAGARASVPARAAFQIDEMARGRGIDEVYLFALRALGSEGLARLPDAGEGLADRAARAARAATGLEDFISRVKCKRYTRARIVRLAAHALIGLTADLAQRHGAPEYARLVGARSDAGAVLRELKARSQLPFARAAELRGDEVFELECRAADAWALAFGRPAGLEFTEKFVRV